MMNILNWIKEKFHKEIDDDYYFPEMLKPWVIHLETKVPMYEDEYL